jgi:type II secretory pathway component PulJ
MSASNGINYRETYFEYPELTKIHGEPNSESLFKLRNELKANAQSVYSNLSDGAHGHLALVLNDAQYAFITNQPFIRPVHPGPLQIPLLTTAPMITALKEAHYEQLRLFREVQGVEKALIQQIVKAVEATYLASLRDRNSNSLRGTINQILEHLQVVYGRVSPQMLEDRKQELRNMNYNAKYPIDMVFNAVEDFIDFADLAQQPATERQTIAKAYTIINKTRRFKTAITEWNRRPPIQQSWIAFKDHFRQAHQELRETTDVTLEDSELQRNNANLVQQVVDGMQNMRDEESSAILEQMANSATRTSDAQQQLVTQLAQMQQAMALLQTQVNTQHRPYSPPFQHNGGQNSFRNQGGRSNNGRGNRQAPRGRGNPYRQRNTSKYCWTHGGCGHNSPECFSKLPGHQDTSTFQDTMGGNTNHCPST